MQDHAVEFKTQAARELGVGRKLFLIDIAVL
jgi:hypothetical protein